MRTLIPMTMAVALAAAAVVPVAAQSEGAARPSSGCEAPLAAPGDYEAVNDFDGADQKHFVIVPEHYAEISPAPLYLFLGSGGGDAHLNYAGWRDAFDDEPMVIAIVGTETTTQQAPATLLALVDELAADYCIDLRRVHVGGSSSSAHAAAQLACEGPDRIASFKDGMGSFLVKTCDPERQVPLLAITGNSDRPWVTQSVERWAETNGRDPEPLVDDSWLGCLPQDLPGLCG